MIQKKIKLEYKWELLKEWTEKAAFYSSNFEE